MRPMLATAAAPGVAPPSGAEWAHEVKWDGMRVLADVVEGRLRLYSRTEADVTVSFPELAGLADVAADVLLDGEVVALVDGIPSFGALGERMHVRDQRRAAALAARSPVSFIAFDVLRLYGVPLLDRSFTDRRQTLERLDLGDGPWQVPPVFDDGPTLLAATREQGLEGIVSKRRTSRYQPGRRSRDWVKRAHRESQTYVVGGWRPQTGHSSTLGALLLGVPGADGTLTFVGRAGSGIGQTMSADLTRLLTPLARDTPPFRDRVPRPDALGAVWVEPRVCVDVDHLGLGGQGRLRQPSVRGIRTDVRPEELLHEPG